MSMLSRAQLFMDRETGWWNADFGGGMEKLAVEAEVTGTASGSKSPDWKAGHWSSGVAITKGGEVKE